MEYLTTILENLLGTYTPVMSEDIAFIAGEPVLVSSVASGAAGVDWPWIASAALLLLMVYSVFRIVRCLIAR